jgi:hypothetical protein
MNKDRAQQACERRSRPGSARGDRPLNLGSLGPYLCRGYPVVTMVDIEGKEHCPHCAGGPVWPRDHRLSHACRTSPGSGPSLY